MSALLLATAFAGPLILGCAIAARCCPEPLVPGGRIFRLSLGFGIGSGVLSTTFFLWLLAAGRPGYGFIGLEGLLVAIGCAAWLVRGRAPSQSSPGPAAGGADALSGVLRPIFWSLLAGAVVLHILISAAHPHGLVDAWGMWNMRAKTLFHGGLYWHRVFGPHITSADHPLLLPGFVSRLWMFIGQDIQIAPVAVALFFAAATGLLLVSSLTTLRGRSQGYLAGIVLLGTGFFVEHAATQYADVPLAFYVLAAFSLIALHDSGRVHGPGPLLLAGLTAGLAAWTKNEGLLFLAATTTGRLIRVHREGGRETLKGLGVFLLGALPLICLAFYVKFGLAPPNYIFSFQGPEVTVERLLNTDRHLLIATTFLRMAWQHFGWQSVMLAVYFLLVGPAARERRDTGWAWSTLGLMVARYYCTYAVSPVNLTLHLDTSVHRVLLQMWPGLLLTYFLSVKTIGETGFSTTPGQLQGSGDR